MSHDFSITPFCKHCGVEKQYPPLTNTIDCPGLRWFILRILQGRPLKIASVIAEEFHVESYCPSETIERTHPHNRQRKIEVTRPLIPGYIFTARIFDTEQLPPAMLAAARKRAEQRALTDPRQKPSTSDCRVTWLTFDNRYVTISPRSLDAVREAERAKWPGEWRPEIETIVQALADCVSGVAPRNYINLADLQSLSTARAA